ncbi:hypothetical protein [Saliphagus infecundisoli]|uniref:Neutral/alkaline non-lysosomal ceramidase N-terminal domain-containing protein n=1 Tax=Saliphagus infecundisoli TaxID=1849069 RepID=A0ABD5Q9X3_9EURY|nr:hypothetical protein [Saliphagus infecundisoli]
MTRAANGGEKWHVGTATRTITPEEPMWMAGFAKRDEPADGQVHDLSARAVAIDDGERVAVVASVELLFVTREIRERVARRCTEAYGLEPDALLLAATHTHCGPEFREFKLDMYADEGPYHERAADYRERLIDDLVGVVGEALDDREPATLSYSHARCGFGTNRRLPVPEGVAHVPNPDGPVDTEVPVLVAESEERDENEGSEEETRIRAILFGYACHTTTVMIERYCGDWAGFARREIESEYPEATALFLQGAAGDQNPYPRRELALARRHGETAATAVRAAVESRRKPVRGPLQALLVERPIAFEDPPERAELEEMAESDRRYLRVRAEALLAELDEHGEIRTEHPYPIQGLGFDDDLTLLGLGGEVLVGYSLKLKERLPGPVWVAGYTNAEFTYVPTAQAIHEGGYEGGEVVRRTAFPGPLRPDVEERVLGGATAVADRVRCDRREY